MMPTQYNVISKFYFTGLSGHSLIKTAFNRLAKNGKVKIFLKNKTSFFKIFRIFRSHDSNFHRAAKSQFFPASLHSGLFPPRKEPMSRLHKKATSGSILQGLL